MMDASDASTGSSTAAAVAVSAMAVASTYASVHPPSASAVTATKRKRSTQGCLCEANDVLVEELKKVKSRVRDPTSHLAANYARAISSIMHHTAPIRDGREAKQLKNIGNYLANQIQAILHKKRLRTGSGSAAADESDAPLSGVQQLQQLHAQAVAARAQAAVAAVSVPPAHIAAAAPIATRVFASEISHKDYAPAYKKQPWFVILAMSAERATSEAAAISTDTLLRKMQSAGYDGNLSKLRTCLASLCGTHEVVRRTAAGLLFLTEKGQRSVRLCPGQLSSASDTPSRITSTDGVTPVITSVAPMLQQIPPLAARPAPAAFSASSVRTSERRTAPSTTSVVCIDLSDSEGAAFSGDDDDDVELEVNSFEYEPDEEPMHFVESPKPPPVPQQQQQPSLSEPAASVATDDGGDCDTGDLIAATDEWELVLVLDHREILSRQNRHVLERKLLERNVTCEVRALNVGDMQWIAKRYRAGRVAEFVLNAIVERKEVRDLSGSIVDRRYNEQKARLRASGLTHVVYLVEGSFTQQTTVRAAGLQTALCRTQVQDQFFVQLCQNADETVAFLAAVHARLLAKFPPDRCRNPERNHRVGTSHCTLPCAPAPPSEFARVFCRPTQSFATFNALFRKKNNFTVSEIYQMMLTQVPGFSVAKAAGVSTAYPTFRALRYALLSEDSAAAKNSTRKRSSDSKGVESVRCGESQRRLGAKARACLAYLLTAAEYSDSEDVAESNDVYA